jgi:hypothetical protein
LDFGATPWSPILGFNPRPIYPDFPFNRRGFILSLTGLLWLKGRYSMLQWLADQILKISNYVPELILGEGDPRFDFLRWWLLFVLIATLLFIVSVARRALRKTKPPTS